MQALNKINTESKKILKKVWNTATGKIRPLKFKNITPKNKINIFISLILVFAIALPAYLASCSSPELGFGEIVISEDAEKNTNAPINPKSEFDINAKQIFATIKYTGVTGADSWRFKWIYEKTGEMILDAGKKYNEAQPEGYFQGIMASNIYIANDTKKIPAGNYKVSFYHNEELKKSADFIVNEPQMKIMEAVTSSLIDERGTPLSPVAQFKTTDTVYASIKTNYLISGHNLKVIWKKSDSSHIKEEAMDIKENYYEASYIGFSLELLKGEKGEKPVAPGKYRVEIYLDNELDKTLEFEVVKEKPATFIKGATYTNELFGFTIAIPDDWTYEEKADKNIVTLTLKPTVIIDAAFGFVATAAAPLKPFDEFAKKGAESFAKEHSWILADSKSKDYNIKNGAPAKEIVYLYKDIDEVQYVIAYSFIEYTGNVYILHIASDNAIYGDMASSVYLGILDSLVFKTSGTTKATTQN
jgi:hypothetical protein